MEKEKLQNKIKEALGEYKSYEADSEGFPKYPGGRKEDPNSVGDRLSRDSGKTFRKEMQDYTTKRETGQKPVLVDDLRSEKGFPRGTPNHRGTKSY